jgi:hypothetical protein
MNNKAAHANAFITDAALYTDNTPASHTHSATANSIVRTAIVEYFIF